MGETWLDRPARDLSRTRCPLASGLLSRLSKSSELEEGISASLPDNVRLVFVNRASGSGFEITVESDVAAGKEILPKHF